MGIELKSISKLNGMSFYIPCYQRGYRWTEQQVKDLLNDIDEFCPQNENGFYCLQPIVVKDRKSEKDVLCKINDKIGGFTNIDEIKQLLLGEWEVIDGQQRLTTIYLILKYLEQKLFTISYETRKDSKDFLEDIKEDKAKSNIDFFHIWKAYKYIEDWFDSKRNDESELLNKLKGQVKVIWYESENEDSVKVFTRLNIGKISLTNAELIKALFLNRSNFERMSLGEEHLKLRQQEIASEWDNIEYTLQNDEFWLFLNNVGYSNPTRIDFIFDIICQDDKLGIKEAVKEKHANHEWDKIIGTDGYRTFRYFYEYFQLEEHDIVECWRLVKKYFQIFIEWYNDLTLYHYIGYCIIECGRLNIQNIINKWDECANKELFVDFLKDEITKKINTCPPLDHQYKEDGGDKRKCEPILLFHNIQTVINQNTKQQENENYQFGVFYKFPFHLYKLEGWDVEHINSNTENPETDEDTRKEWLVNVYLSSEPEMQKKIENYLNNGQGDWSDLYEEIKKVLPEREQWTQEEKNRIWNYALLDSSTNRSYGNSIFSGKRRVIIGKDKGIYIPIPNLTRNGKLLLSEEAKSISSFIPPCTKQVFLKYYSPATGDSNYWLKKPDAESYLQDIRERIKQLDKQITKTK